MTRGARAGSSRRRSRRVRRRAEPGSESGQLPRIAGEDHGRERGPRSRRRSGPRAPGRPGARCASPGAPSRTSTLRTVSRSTSASISVEVRPVRACGSGVGRRHRPAAEAALDRQCHGRPGRGPLGRRAQAVRAGPHQAGQRRVRHPLGEVGDREPGLAAAGGPAGRAGRGSVSSASSPRGRIACQTSSSQSSRSRQRSAARGAVRATSGRHTARRGRWAGSSSLPSANS